LDRPELESHAKSPLNITALLHDLEAGQHAALNRLVEVAYPELRRIAHRECGRERQSSTLQCTAVVHEAWLRLAHAQHTTWKDRAHFFAFASRLMRSILIDYARARNSVKRGGGTPALTLIDTDAVTPRKTSRFWNWTQRSMNWRSSIPYRPALSSCAISADSAFQRPPRPLVYRRAP